MDTLFEDCYDVTRSPDFMPPVSYQGGKSRIADKIVGIMKPSSMFYDLCCGSGAISIAIRKSGVDPQSIIMIDAGPWGKFWEMVGKGVFDLNTFWSYCDSVPKDLSKVQDYMISLSQEIIDDNFVYVYLLLQASSFGAKAIWIEDGKWKNLSCRDHWHPTNESNRRSPVNPMTPMPETIFQRAKSLCGGMKGITGIYGNVEDVKIVDKSVVYCDPPYLETTGYGHVMDMSRVVENAKGSKLYISEGKSLSPMSWKISEGRKKGGISGDRKVANEEWLSLMVP